jgi:hypothetical protein
MKKGRGEETKLNEEINQYAECKRKAVNSFIEFQLSYWVFVAKQVNKRLARSGPK